VFNSDNETPSNQLTPVPLDKKENTRQSVKICLQCRTSNAASSNYCYKCGQKLPEQVATTASQVKICVGCHASNLPTSQFCYKCGLKLTEQVSAPIAVSIPAGFWSRFASFLIDNIVVIIGGFVLAIITAAIFSAIFPNMVNDYSVNEYTWEALIQASNRPATWIDWIIISFFFGFGIAYWTVLIGWKGQSLGKFILGLKVVNTDGSRTGFLRAFGRVWGYIFDMFLLGIGFLTIAFDEQKRGLHDIIFRTKVVKT
jgi:uncharacterized RDD family membrane protein YckC/ribosomal protein L40E